MQLDGRQKLYAQGAALIILGGVAFTGAKWLKPEAPLSVQALKGKPPVISSAPSEPTAEVEPPKLILKEVVVALAGAVKKPGLYHLPLESRIDDAIKAAGGSIADADLEAINLAAKAVDGEQIYVPHKKTGEPDKAKEVTRVAERYRGGEIGASYSVRPISPSMPPTLGGSPSKTGASTKAKATGPVSLNTGSEAQLQTLPGVGPATAAKIVEYRLAHGGFTSVEEIQAVKGIGPKKFEKMKPFLKL